MGMFDWYEPAENSASCPRCGTPLRIWQGKDGPCGLVVWKQFVASPIGQRNGDPESEWLPGDMAVMRLPQRFEIYSYDCPKHRPIDRVCATEKEVWTISGPLVVRSRESQSE